jgi:hypothetical protein
MSNKQNEILREVSPGEVFRFYTGLNQPTALSANSLGDLLTKIKSVQIQSVEFHASRGDFQNWLEMLGDQRLARQMAELARENLKGEPLRQRSIRLLESRYRELTQPQNMGGEKSGRSPGQTPKRKNRS